MGAWTTRRSARIRIRDIRCSMRMGMFSLSVAFFDSVIYPALKGVEPPFILRSFRCPASTIVVSIAYII